MGATGERRLAARGHIRRSSARPHSSSSPHTTHRMMTCVSRQTHALHTLALTFQPTITWGKINTEWSQPPISHSQPSPLPMPPCLASIKQEDLGPGPGLSMPKTLFSKRFLPLITVLYSAQALLSRRILWAPAMAAAWDVRHHPLASHHPTEAVPADALIDNSHQHYESFRIPRNLKIINQGSARR